MGYQDHQTIQVTIVIDFFVSKLSINDRIRKDQLCLKVIESNLEIGKFKNGVILETRGISRLGKNRNLSFCLCVSVCLSVSLSLSHTHTVPPSHSTEISFFLNANVCVCMVIKLFASLSIANALFAKNGMVLAAKDPLSRMILY